MRRLRAIDELQLERRADLLEDDVDDEAGVARGVVKLQHGRPYRRRERRRDSRPLMAQAGFVLSYGTDLAALSRRAASFVDKILKGARPGELPIELPAKFELVANLDAARAIGMTLPAAMLQRADRLVAIA